MPLDFAMLQKSQATLMRLSPALPGCEQRAWVRYPDPTNSPYQLIEAETEYGWWASVRDVSLGGLAIVLAQRLPPGDVADYRQAVSVREAVARSVGPGSARHRMRRGLAPGM
jgi:hypothetical protein